MTDSRFISLDFHEYPPEEMQRRAADFRAEMQRRRSVRDFADRPVPRIIIEDCLRTAGSAPSGANMQPWHFVAVAEPSVKKKIRDAAEEEEREFYANRAPDEWLDALAPLGTDASKPFLETAPCLIAIFAQRYGLDPDGARTKHYYIQESVGIATGLVVAGDIIGEGASEERAVLGDTPNLAARLQSLAKPDTVVISAATLSLVDGLFDFRDLGAQRI
ncbi:MAG: hypothetical protein HOC74_42300, partial [Gemmatimonadetes bacterium]|nr:hypothetical protein [Gemmatimonadota bacterium]